MKVNKQAFLNLPHVCVLLEPDEPGSSILAAVMNKSNNVVDQLVVNMSSNTCSV